MDATETLLDAADTMLGALAPALGRLSLSQLCQALRDLGQRASLEALRPVAACMGPRCTDAFGILMYHRVTPHFAGVPKPTLSVTPQQFRRQMRGLLENGYQPWSLRAVLEARRCGKPIPRNVFVVTFDDGYECVYRYAWPILSELGIPATVFVTTAYLDSQRPFPFDEWTAKGSAKVAPESWRPLSTGQCEEMLAAGRIEIGCHTHTHGDFRGKPCLLRSDVQQSLDVLCTRFGTTDVTFAFPYGSRRLGTSGPRLAAAAREAGIVCALTTEPELARRSNDPFDWGRFAIRDSDSAASIATLLSGWYDLVHGGWWQLRQFAQSERLS